MQIAQTNLQLYNELLALEWTATELADTRRTYELAAELFSGLYRCSGKPFVAHVVGTASVVAAVDGRRDLVLAALLHAAYTDGDFGAGRGSTDARARSRVRSVVGSDAEELVLAYERTPWNAPALAVADADFDNLDARQRDVLVLRIANEADEHADLGVRFCDKGGLDLYRESSVTTMVELADRLERPSLGALLRELVADEHDAAVPAALRSSGLASDLQVPASYRLRLRLVVDEALRRVRGAARRLRTGGRTR